MEISIDVDNEQVQYEFKKRQIVKQIKLINIEKFRRIYPELSKLGNSQIMVIFDKYRANQERLFTNQNISFLVSGTLIIFVSTLFMNAASAKLAYDLMEPNIIVMNTVIASAAGGCCIFLQN